MASGLAPPAVTLLVTVATAPATTPRMAVAAVDNLDGFGGGLRSRRRRVAAERAATFFLAVLVTFFAAGFRAVFRAVFRRVVFFLVDFFATFTSAGTACMADAECLFFVR